jgi:hypothetical protein
VASVVDMDRVSAWTCRRAKRLTAELAFEPCVKPSHFA